MRGRIDVHSRVEGFVLAKRVAAESAVLAAPCGFAAVHADGDGRDLERFFGVFARGPGACEEVSIGCGCGSAIKSTFAEAEVVVGLVRAANDLQGRGFGDSFGGEKWGT